MRKTVAFILLLSVMSSLFFGCIYETVKNAYNFYNVGCSSIREAVYFSDALIYKLFYECSPYV